MLPVDIPDGNIELELLGEGLKVKAYVGLDASGERCFIMAWKASKEDMEALALSGVIGIKVMGVVLPPLALYTVNKKGEANVE